MKLLRTWEPPLFDDCAHRRLGLSDRVFKRSTSSNAQNWTPQKCKTNLRPGKSYDISVWLGSFVAELDRKSCAGFRCGQSGSSSSRKDEWAEGNLFDIYDTLLVFTFLWSFVVFICFLNLFRTGVSGGVEDFDIEEGSAESWIEKSVCFDV